MPILTAIANTMFDATGTRLHEVLFTHAGREGARQDDADVQSHVGLNLLV